MYPYPLSSMSVRSTARARNVDLCTHRCGSGASGARCVHVHSSPSARMTGPSFRPAGQSRSLHRIPVHRRLVEISGRSFRLIIALDVRSSLFRPINRSLPSPPPLERISPIHRLPSFYLSNHTLIDDNSPPFRNRKEGVRFEGLNGKNGVIDYNNKGDNGVDYGYRASAARNDEHECA